jgi:hypothetical protein
MKKETSLADQVRDAQRTVSGWSEQKRVSVRLEGLDVYLTKDARRHSNLKLISAPENKKK